MKDVDAYALVTANSDQADRHNLSNTKPLSEKSFRGFLLAVTRK